MPRVEHRDREHWPAHGRWWLVVCLLLAIAALLIMPFSEGAAICVGLVAWSAGMMWAAEP